MQSFTSILNTILYKYTYYNHLLAWIIQSFTSIVNTILCKYTSYNPLQLFLICNNTLVYLNIPIKVYLILSNQIKYLLHEDLIIFDTINSHKFELYIKYKNLTIHKNVISDTIYIW